MGIATVRRAGQPCVMLGGRGHLRAGWPGGGVRLEACYVSNSGAGGKSGTTEPEGGMTSALAQVGPAPAPAPGQGSPLLGPTSETLARAGSE